VSLFPTVDELRQYIETDLPDQVLAAYSAEADAAIVARYGSHSADITPPLIKFMYGGDSVLLHVPEVVSAIHENGVLLVAGTDYRKRQDHVYERLPLGHFWGEDDPDFEVEVRYAPLNDTEARKRILVQLVKLTMDYNGLKTERVGDYGSESLDFEAERRRIFKSLRYLKPVVA
jgi:hypothetical protein